MKWIMSRRKFKPEHPRRCALTGNALQRLGLFCLGLWFTTALWAAPIPRLLIKDSPYGRPNLVVFLAESLTYEDLPPYHATNRAGPHWQQLAAEGVRFDTAYGAGPQPEEFLRLWLTGSGSPPPQASGQSLIPPSPVQPALPLLLQKSGYTTGMLGWWPAGEGWPPLAQGFEEWLGSFDRTEARQVHPRFLHRNERRHEFNPPSTPQRFAAPQLLLTAVTNFIRTSRLYPFYLQIIYPSPATNASRQEWLERLDRDLGALLAALQQQRLDTQTVVIAGGLTAWPETPKPPRPLFSPEGWLRRSTNGVYEGDLRIPLLMRWPGKLPAGVTNRHALTLPDVHATLAAWGDVPLPPEARGLSRAAWLLGLSRTHPPVRAHWFHQASGAAALRDGAWKIVRPHRLAPWELYDLEKDLGEQNNLASRQPEKLQELLKQWQSLEEGRSAQKPASAPQPP